MQIRRAKITDINTLVKLDKEVNLTPWEGDNYLACLTNLHQFIYVLQSHSGVIIAAIVINLILNEAEILQFWVRLGYQRCGHATTLLKFIMNKPTVSRIFLEVRANNLAAIKLYQSLGFKVVGQRKNYYKIDNWRFDALIMLLNQG